MIKETIDAEEMNKYFATGEAFKLIEFENIVRLQCHDFKLFYTRKDGHYHRVTPREDAYIIQFYIKSGDIVPWKNQ